MKKIELYDEVIFDREIWFWQRTNGQWNFVFQELESILQGYLKRFSEIAGSMINCGSILNWLEVNCLEWPADFWFPCSWLPLDLCSNYSLSTRLWLCGRKGGDSVCRDVMFNPSYYGSWNWFMSSLFVTDFSRLFRLNFLEVLKSCRSGRHLSSHWADLSTRYDFPKLSE